MSRFVVALVWPLGRTSRLHYWLFFGAFVLVAYLNNVVARVYRVPDLSTWIQFIFLWPVLVVLSRRLQDFHASGWFALLYFAPAIVIGLMQRPDLMGYAVPAKIAGFVILGIIPSFPDSASRPHSKSEQIVDQGNSMPSNNVLDRSQDA
jgi:uncharacterized membrane protein YhaH (DUF805 family)